MIVCRNHAMCSRSFFYFLLFWFSASLWSLDAEIFSLFSILWRHLLLLTATFSVFPRSRRCFFTLHVFLLIFSFSASLSSKYSSKSRLSSSLDDRIFLEMLQLSRKKCCIEPVLGKTADRKTIMHYHPPDQTEKTIINYHVEFEHVQTAW